MRTGNVQEAAYLVVKGHPVKSLTPDRQGWVLIEFDDAALAHLTGFKADDLVPVRTYFKAYKALMSRVAQARMEQRVGGQHA